MTYCLEGSCSIQLSYRHTFLERVMGIEPTQSAWKAEILPLNYTRIRILPKHSFDLNNYTISFFVCQHFFLFFSIFYGETRKIC